MKALGNKLDVADSMQNFTVKEEEDKKKYLNHKEEYCGKRKMRIF